MKKYISFRPSAVSLYGYLRLTVTGTVFKKLQNCSLDGGAVLKALSESPVLLFLNTKRKNQFRIHTENGFFICKERDDSEALLLIDFQKNALLDQNKALKFGIGFTVENLIVEVRLFTSYGISGSYVHGRLYDNYEYQEISSEDAIRKIQKVMAKASKSSLQSKDALPEDDSDDEPDYEPAKKLSNLLALSENYSVLASELEKNTVNAIGQVSYHDLSSVQYDRIDRLAYGFSVDSMDESHFKAGVQIDIEDKIGKRHTAEIVSVTKEFNGYKLIALFADHIDISLLNTAGWFTLSFSTVNRDVQLEANEKIKTGTAAAKYFDAIFGVNNPSGFTAKNLSELKNELNSKKYPPNKSQVDAITSGIETNDVFLVMGPPGTGKTTVILEWVKYFVLKERKRVLVSSQNNKAVDNVLARIAEEEGIDTIRIGSESKVQSDVVPFLFENKIKAKREEIIAETKTGLFAINIIADDWTKYFYVLKSFFWETAKVAGKENIFKMFVTQNVLPLYKELVSLYDTNRDIRLKKKNHHASITELYQTIDDARTSKKLLQRLKGMFLYLSRSKALKKMIAEYDSICSQEKRNVSEYNRCMQDMNKVMGDAYFNSFSEYYEDYCARLSKADKVIGQKPSGNNMWKLFSNIQISLSGLSQSGSFKQLLEAIVEEIDRLSKIRASIENWQSANSKQNYALNEIILDSVNLVGATCIGINSQKRFSDLHFDVTIIDEAGQIQIHNALVPMSVSNKLIMLGDHKQIPPTADQEMIDACIQNEIPVELLEKSLFEKMYEFLPETNKIMLNTQYRMPAEIANTISDWFYDKQYYSPDFKKGLPGLIPQLSAKPYIIIDTSLEQNRNETRIPDAGSNNQLEATIVYKIIRYIISSGLELDLNEIGVISAYKSQVKLIISMLKEIVDKNFAEEMVATLDSFQGQERDLIIYSFTKSSNISPNRKRIGFLNELRRLNVAMTRCKKMLILVGDMSFLSSCENVEYDNMQQPVYDKSEKQFSDFIKKMKNDVESGSGELLTYGEFEKRIKI